MKSLCGIQNTHTVSRKGRNPLPWAMFAPAEAIPVQLSLQPVAHISLSL